MVIDGVQNIFPTARDAQDEFFTSEAEEALRPRLVIKEITQGIVSSTTMRNDDELFISVESDSTYEFEILFEADQGHALAPDIHFTVVGPTDTIGRYWITLRENSISTSLEPLNFGVESGGTISETKVWFGIMGWLKTLNTAGNLQFQWAQASSSGHSVRVFEGSWLTITKQ